ncbi:hypothetical protein AGMMS5026_00850 [Endomicrobiia bacterium]|nr:hypothetical protein AGMMS49523_05890 [Endomicrobiia bacterium]GHT11639.1 hypothetical protein AGMMS49571_02270 [Endomicrobiia bacterium]GHT20497.1 hypothetical protein AGMMS49929_07270 [Endomicrobiia bacterium]GHT26763.1 hypothetical protein AGMMS49995_04160 [Endomicrobiia bacterium]GHT29482.1 hypothetical protein AGMMS5026_00850 [Endomicrobiia bacterium]
MKNHIVAKVMSGCKSSYDRAILKGAAHSPDIAETYSNIGKDQTIRAYSINVQKRHRTAQGIDGRI